VLHNNPLYSNKVQWTCEATANIRFTLVSEQLTWAGKIMKVILIGCFILIVFISCNTDRDAGLTQIKSPHVITITAPAAGNYPAGLYKYPYKTDSQTQTTERFTQTIEWSPAVSKTFNTNTRYTAILTLEPVNRRHTFKGISIDDITGLPADGAENISIETKGRNLVISILFKSTANRNAAAQLLFSDEFNGNTLDKSKWEPCPEWDRQGRSTWRDDMVSVSGGMLRLKFMLDPALGRARSQNKALADSWIRAGAVRTQTKNWNILFSNSFGFYEARIKFPVVSGTWGAFWLMSPTQWLIENEGKDGTEIDIIETIGSHNGEYNSALHWDGYEGKHKSVGSDVRRNDNPPPDIKIYDGEYHIFALDWSPSEYIFYIDGKVFWRVDGSSIFNNSGINQNPNYIKLSVESADWAGYIPIDFTEAEMLVDYVRVYNQPRIGL